MKRTLLCAAALLSMTSMGFAADLPSRALAPAPVLLAPAMNSQMLAHAAVQANMRTLGERGVPGADAAHFNLPTDVAVLADGSFYVSDGYKNTRVVKFTADGKYDFEWGGKGAGQGQFNLPHGVAVDATGRVIVCDRTNSRLQVFDPRGKFLTEWKGPLIGRPYGVSIGAEGHVFLIDGGDLSSPKSVLAIETDLVETLRQ